MYDNIVSENIIFQITCLLLLPDPSNAVTRDNVPPIRPLKTKSFGNRGLVGKSMVANSNGNVSQFSDDLQPAAIHIVTKAAQKSVAIFGFCLDVHCQGLKYCFRIRVQLMRGRDFYLQVSSLRCHPFLRAPVT